MTGDREEIAARIVPISEVREALGVRTDAAARAWLSDHHIGQVQGYPQDEVSDAMSRRPGSGNYLRSNRRRKAEENKD